MSNSNYITAAAILFGEGDEITISHEDRITLLTMVSQMESKIEGYEHAASCAANFIAKIGEGK